MILPATDEVGWKILELLGVEDKYIVEATIHIKVNSAITADVTSLVHVDGKFVMDEGETELEKVLKKYRLVEIRVEE